MSFSEASYKRESLIQIKVFESPFFSLKRAVAISSKTSHFLLGLISVATGNTSHIGRAQFFLHLSKDYLLCDFFHMKKNTLIGITFPCLNLIPIAVCRSTIERNRMNHYIKWHLLSEASLCNMK